MDRYYLLKKAKGLIKSIIPSEEEIEKYGKKEPEPRNPYNVKPDKYLDLEERAEWAANQILKKYPNISHEELVKKSAELMKNI